MNVDSETSNVAMDTVSQSTVESNDLDAVKLLLANGGDVNQSNENGETLLLVAVQNGNLELVDLLLEKGADYDESSNTGMTPIYFAASKKENLAIVQSLAWAGANVASHMSPLNIASHNNNLEIVKLLLNVGADITIPDNDGKTALFIAVEVLGVHLDRLSDNLEIINLLLDEGSDVNKHDNAGNTPFIYAVDQSHVELVQSLMEHGANIHDQFDKMTPLWIATNNDDLPMIKVLLAAGPDVNMPDKHGTTPFSNASANGFLDIMKILISAGADIDIPDEEGSTPLVDAIMMGEQEIVVALLELGADINTHDINGYTPLTLACEYGYLEIVQLLLDNGDDINKPNNKDKRTPLFFAVSYYHSSLVKLLLERGADTELYPIDGFHQSPNGFHQSLNSFTPLKLSINDGLIETVKLLLKYYNDYDVIKPYLTFAWTFCHGLEGQFDGRCVDNETGNRKKILHLLQDKVVQLKPDEVVQPVPLPEAEKMSVSEEGGRKTRRKTKSINSKIRRKKRKQQLKTRKQQLKTRKQQLKTRKQQLKTRKQQGKKRNKRMNKKTKRRQGGDRKLTQTDVIKFNSRRNKNLKKDNCGRLNTLVNNLDTVSTNKAEKILKILQENKCGELVTKFTREMNKKMFTGGKKTKRKRTKRNNVISKH